MTRHTLALLLAAVLLPSLALAAPPPPRGDGPPPGEGVDSEKHEALMERIRLVRMYALTEALDLDEATAARLFPYLKDHDATVKELHQAKRSHRKALREMIASEEFTEEAVDEHVSALAAIEVEMAEAQQARTEGLKDILTAEQRAKYVMVRERLEKEIRQIIREHRQKRRDERREERKARRDRNGPPD